MKSNFTIEKGKITITDIYWCDHHLYYAFNIYFDETTSNKFFNLVAICASYISKEDAKRYLYNLKRRLKHIGIEFGK